MTWDEADVLMKDGKVVRRDSWNDTKSGVFFNPSHLFIPCMVGFRNKLPNRLITVDDIYWRLYDGVLKPYTPSIDDLNATDWVEQNMMSCI